MNDFLKTYGGHLATYLTSALALVAGLDPGLMGPHGPLIVALAGVLAGGASNIHVATSTAPDAIKAASATVKVLFVVLMVSTLASVLTACKTAPTATEQAGISVAVDIATGAAIQQGSNDPAAWKAKATTFKSIALEVKGVNDGGTATLATLQADIEPLLIKLPPADQLAARALITGLTPFVMQELQGNPTLSNTQAALDVILQAVIDACTAYGA